MTSLPGKQSGLDRVGTDDNPPPPDAVLEDGPLAEGNAEQHRLGENAFYDITDRENDEFIYVL